MSDPNLIRDLAAAGLDPDLLQRVVLELARASAEREAIEARRLNDRERQARRRHVTSREVTGHHATSRDTAPERTPTSFSSSETVPPSPPKGGSVPQGTRPDRKTRNRALPADWQPGERSERVRRELGRPVAWMQATAVDMRTWAESTGNVRADWDATHDGWMRREAKRESERPHPRAGPITSQRLSGPTAAALARRSAQDRPDEPAFDAQPARPIRPFPSRHHANGSDPAAPAEHPTGGRGPPDGDPPGSLTVGPGAVLDLRARRIVG